MSRRRRMGTAMAAGLVAIAGCQNRGGVKAALPAPPPMVEVRMDEFAFRYPTPVPPGRVVLRLRNTGRLAHRMTMVALEEDMPPIAEQLRGTKRRSTTAFAAVPPMDTGASATIAVDLVRGVRYGLLCFITEPDGTSHALVGMASEFRAGGRDARPPATSPTTTAADDDVVDE